MRRALIPSPRSSLLNCAVGREQYLLQHHFLDSCFLCQKKLAQNSDIFMYRGNTPFCSKECRQEQMEIDDSRDKKSWKVSSSSASSSSSSVKGSHRSADSNKSRSSKAVQTGTVAVLS